MFCAPKVRLKGEMMVPDLSEYSTLALLLLVVLIAIAALILHKVRKIHLATYALLSDSDATRRETRVLFSQLQALLALERVLDMPRALPPLRGWAGSPDFLLHLAEDLLKQRPLRVLECSSGVSTLVAARCVQKNRRGHVFSLEHDEEYAQKTKGLLEEYGLSDWATVIHAPLAEHDGAPWYSLDTLPTDAAPIDVLVVDGPPASVAPLARYPALPRLLPRMARSFVVYLDDAARDDEKAVVARWLSEIPGLMLQSPPCEKGLAILRRGDQLC